MKPMMEEQIAKELGISRGRVSQLLNRAYRKIRAAFPNGPAWMDETGESR